MSLPVSFSYVGGESVSSLATLQDQKRTLTSINTVIPKKGWVVAIFTETVAGGGAADFLVTGTRFGTIVTETIACVANKVESGFQYYDTITSVVNTNNKATTNVAVGIADYVAPGQTFTQGDDLPLVFHGNLPAPLSDTGEGTWFFSNIATGYKISIWVDAAVDASAVTFTLRGTKINGVSITTGTVAGPDNSGAGPSFTQSSDVWNSVIGATVTVAALDPSLNEGYFMGVIDCIANVASNATVAGNGTVTLVSAFATSFPKQEWFLVNGIESGGCNYTVKETGVNQFNTTKTATFIVVAANFTVGAECFSTVSSQTSIVQGVNYNLGINSYVCPEQPMQLGTFAPYFSEAEGMQIPIGTSGKVIIIPYGGCDLTQVNISIGGSLNGVSVTDENLFAISNGDCIVGTQEFDIINSIEIENIGSVTGSFSIGLHEWFAITQDFDVPTPTLTLTSTPYTFSDGIPKILTLTSTAGNDLSGFSFEAAGLDVYGNAITATWTAGPNNSTVQTNEDTYFLTVNSITNTSPTGFYTLIEAGTIGLIGEWVNLDFNRDAPMNTGLFVTIPDGSTLNYSFQITPDMGVYTGEPITNIYLLEVGADDTFTTSQYALLDVPATGIRFLVNSGDGSATFTVIQQGN